MATTPHGIPLADGSTVVNPIQAPLNAMANAVDAALDDTLTAIAGVGMAKGTAAQRVAAAAETTAGSYWTDTTDNLLYRHNGTKWLIAPGQILASMIGPTTNTVGNGFNVGPVISTPIVPIDQRVKIVANFSQYNINSSGPSVVATYARNNAENVTDVAFDLKIVSRTHSSAASFVASGRGCAALMTATVAAKITATIVVSDSNSGVYGADGTHLWIESA